MKEGKNFERVTRERMDDLAGREWADGWEEPDTEEEPDMLEEPDTVEISDAVGESDTEAVEERWRKYYMRYLPPELTYFINWRSDSEYWSREFMIDAPGLLQMLLIPKNQGANCPKCKAWSEKRHDIRWRQFYDLRVQGYGRNELWIGFPIYQCCRRGCDRKYFYSPKLPFLREPPDKTERTAMTARLKEFILLLDSRVGENKTVEIMGVLSETQ